MCHRFERCSLDTFCLVEMDKEWICVQGTFRELSCSVLRLFFSLTSYQESSFANRKLLEQLTEDGQEKEKLLRELDEAKKVLIYTRVCTIFFSLSLSLTHMDTHILSYLTYTHYNALLDTPG